MSATISQANDASGSYEWIHDMPEFGEVRITMATGVLAIQYDADKDRIKVRSLGLPFLKDRRVVVLSEAANVIIVETRGLGE